MCCLFVWTVSVSVLTPAPACCVSLSQRTDGSLESGVARPRREHDGKKLIAAFGIVALGLCAAAAIIVNHQSAVALEEVFVHGTSVAGQEVCIVCMYAPRLLPCTADNRLELSTANGSLSHSDPLFRTSAP